MLEIDRLHKRFGQRQALSGVSLTVAPGEVYGFVGANGAGKTTTMRIVMGAAEADSGVVRWRGKPVDLAIRRTIGYMPEERGLYPRMKVRAQLRYFARLHGIGNDAAAADEWIERLNLEQYADDDVIKLSLGNQQRVQLATALVHNPDLLVLDEPFSGLDPVAVDIMSEVLLERARTGNSVVFSSHQLDLVERLCDRVGIIRDGVMVQQGTVTELREAVLGSGYVPEMKPVMPSLTELFRDVVRQDS